MRAALLGLLLLSCAGGATAVRADCSDPGDAIDEVICTTQALQGLEDQVAVAYELAMERTRSRQVELDELRRVHLQWRAEHRKACRGGGDPLKRCLEARLRGRLQDLSGVGR